MMVLNKLLSYNCLEMSILLLLSRRREIVGGNIYPYLVPWLRLQDRWECVLFLKLLRSFVCFCWMMIRVDDKFPNEDPGPCQGQDSETPRNREISNFPCNMAEFRIASLVRLWPRASTHRTTRMAIFSRIPQLIECK